MEEKNNQLENTYVTETICTNCKGKGSTMGLRFRKRMSGLGTMLLGFVFGWTADFRFSGAIMILMILAGIVQIILAQNAKCPVCNGTGKVDLTVSRH